MCCLFAVLQAYEHLLHEHKAMHVCCTVLSMMLTLQARAT
jgi:hypothetical protein